MIVVVNNPLSGRNRRWPRLVASLRQQIDAPHRFEEPTNLDAYDKLAADLYAGLDAGRPVDLVCINGGDGTLAHTLSALARTWGETPLPAIALLRGGTMNTIAHGIGLSGKPPAILRRLLHRHAQGQAQPTTTRHLMRIRDGLGVDRYGFLFGNG
ncbi:MAG: diacylglycerol kinase, partial [Oligoflexia bacterium]|nr:diacylglycerol kinase [Oligoflexia bacterium]